MPQKLEDYEVLGVIGAGSSGICYKVRNKFSKELFVWKAVDYGNFTEDHKQMLVSEVNLLRSLKHPNIVKYCGRILHKETTTLYIITEWCEGGDLGLVIKNAKGQGKYLDEQFIWRMLYQISRAIQVCHSHMKHFTIFHRDIKPANVFLDNLGNAKLGDFGLAKVVLPEKEFSKTVVGTPYYMSPELIKGDKYGRKSDIWALGCLVYELCALEPPFSGLSMSELANSIKNGKYNNIPEHYSNCLKKIISFMLSKNYEFRPTIEMILHHPSVVVNIRPYPQIKKSLRTPRTENENVGDSTINKYSDLDTTNIILIEPEKISHNVFKQKWAEKHEALREKEAWLKKREKTIGSKEKALAHREKHLEYLERQSKQTQCKILKKKHIIFDENSGHETEISYAPGDTPVRPTSAKLDPARIRRPEILTNACKLLEKCSKQHSEKVNQPCGVVSTVRRPLITSNYNLSKDQTRRHNLPDMLTVDHKMNKLSIQCGKSIFKFEESNIVGLSETNEDQKTNLKANAFSHKPSIMKQKTKYNKENIVSGRKCVRLKIPHNSNCNGEIII